MSKLKILFFTNIPSPYRIDFFNKLGEWVDLTVLFERTDADDRDRNWLKIDNDSLMFKPVFLKGITFHGDIALCPGVCAYWRDRKYDVRIVGDYATPTGMLSILYMQINNIKYVVECDGGFVREKERKLNKAIKHYLLSKAVYAYSPGKLTDEYLLRYGVSEDKIIRYHFSSVSENDIAEADKMKSYRDKYRIELGVSNKIMVLYVGQIIHRKGIDILIKTASLLSDEYAFYIVGGELSSEYQVLLEELQLHNIIVTGFKQKCEINRYYIAADIFCLPTREDIWGLVINEAMSYSLPIVTTDKCVAGVELLSGQKYAIVNTDDHKQMATNLEIICNSCSQEYGNNNRERSMEYTIDQMARDHLSSFERIVMNEE